MTQKITDYIFSISPKKLAVYLILGPFLLFFIHLIFTIIFRVLSENDAPNGMLSYIILGILFVFSALLVLLWLFWLRSVVSSVEKSKLGIPIRWFNIAFILIIIYLIYTVSFSFLKYFPDEYRNTFTAFSEFIAFGGLLIAYPILCHYAARAISIKQSNKPTTFISALPFTLALFFGTVLAVPFFHKYFSKKTSENSKILIIYGLAIGLFFGLLILGFIAAITGLI